jgi:hypothetical protein
MPWRACFCTRRGPWLLILLIAAACSSAGSQPPPATPFALAQQLVPAAAYVTIYAPRDGAHFARCGAVTVTFEVVGLAPGRQASAVLVQVGDANPTPVRLDGGVVLSLTAFLGEPGVFPVSVTLLTAERTPAPDVPPARISVSCGSPQQAPCTLGRLRAWEAAIRGDIRNQLPPSAFAAEHLAAPESGGECGEERGSGSFEEAVHALFDGDATGDGAHRAAAGLEGLERSAAAGGFNAPAMLALLWARDDGAREGGFAETPDAVRRLKECVRATRGGGAGSESATRGGTGRRGGGAGEDAEGNLGGSAHTGHPLCHMALAFRQWHGLGTRVDVGSAALHYKYAALTAMRTVKVCVCTIHKHTHRHTHTHTHTHRWIQLAATYPAPARLSQKSSTVALHLHSMHTHTKPQTFSSLCQASAARMGTRGC